MKTNQELKNAALAALRGNWTQAVLLALIVTVITAIPSLLGQGDGTASVAGIVSMLIAICVAMPLSVGVYASFRKLYLGQEVKLVEDSFKVGFQNWKHNVGGMLLMIVYVFLWTLLLIIPGIIK